MRQDQDLIPVPGFGFYPHEVSKYIERFREDIAGMAEMVDVEDRDIDEVVCNELGSFWDQSVDQDEKDNSCRPQFDGYLACIPSARIGQEAVLPCIRHYWNGNATIYFDTTYNITKNCLEDGQWDNFTNYTQCLQHQIDPPIQMTMTWEMLVFLLGKSVSVIFLLFAIFIFLYFREMKCLRHKIHLNLFLSVLTADVDWIVTYAVQTTLPCDETYCNAINTIHCILHVLLRYFHLTTFFWMFVEGLYLFLLVQATFTVGRLKLRHCVSIGWGVPSLLTLLWTLLIYCQAQSEVFQESGSGQHLVKSPVNESLLKCPFMVESEANMYNVWTYTVPVCLLLACNFVFSIWIMSVVISKLRSNDVHVSTQNIDLRAAKALIIIVPLLGITYLVTIVAPQKSDTTLASMYILTRIVLISFQGFFITLPYCFLNGEVCTMVKSHWDRWRDRTMVGYGPASARNSIAMQGMYNVNDNRKRSSYGYHTVTTVTTVGGDDRRGTHGETEVVNSQLNRQTSSISSQSSVGNHKTWKKFDGPLVASTPQPDLVQHSQGVDRRDGLDENI